MGFTKLDSKIIDSSIWSESVFTRVVWISILAKCDHIGFVACSRSGLLRSCNIPEKEFDEAIKSLESPDPDSRTPDFEGKRIEKVEGGWIVLNYLKYREFSYSSNPESERKRRYRKGESIVREGYVYFLLFNDRIKIGFSKNPWSRTDEMKTIAPESKLITVIPGTNEDEKKYHERFSHLNIDREWFEYRDDLKNHIEELQMGRVPNVVGHSASASVSSSSSSFKDSEIDNSLELNNPPSKHKKQPPEWKKNCETFITYQLRELAEYEKIRHDQGWIDQQQEVNPRIDIPLTLKKAHINFWSQMGGYKNIKSRKVDTVDWKSTWANALTMRMNQVWQDKNGNNQSESTGIYSKL